jgi:hypothetical protein
MDLQQHLSALESDLEHLTTRLTAEAPSANAYVQRGMMQFKLGRIAASITDFDRAEQLNPALTPYLWQRGLSCCMVVSAATATSAMSRTSTALMRASRPKYSEATARGNIVYPIVLSICFCSSFDETCMV